MYPIIFIVLGVFFGYFFDTSGIEKHQAMVYFSDFALAIGLYGSVYGIDRSILRKHFDE